MAFPYKDISETGLIDLATEAANDFLNEGTPLNDAVCKVARREDLTPHEVHRVVEETNKAAYLALRPKMAAEGTPVFEFEVASREEVLGRLQKRAMEIPRWRPIETEDTTEKVAVDQAARFLHRNQHKIGTAKQINERMLATEELAASEQRQVVFEKKLAADATRDRMVRTVKNLVLQDGWPLYKLAAIMVAHQADAGQLIGEVLGLARARCGMSPGSVTKEAGPYHGRYNRSPTISGEPVLVINGRHSLLIDLDTLVEQTNDLEGEQQGLYRVDDTVAYLRKNLRNLTGRETAKPPTVFRRLERRPRDVVEVNYGK